LLDDESTVTVVVATDSALVGDGLIALLDGVEGIKVVGHAKTQDELLQLVEDMRPQAVIVSIRTKVVTTMSTIQAARKLRVDHPELGIVIIADRGNGFALELLRGGASRIAYLLDERLPGIESVLVALRDVRAGQVVLDPSVVDSLVQRRNGLAIDDLTSRELDVLEQLAAGLSNRAIAAEVHLSLKAIEKYVTTIFRKLELTDTAAIDRRVSAALVYLRAKSNPFG
jgi:DNA-binding NarL/FixJ family response regulator